MVRNILSTLFMVLAAAIMALLLSACASGGKLGAGEKLYRLGEYHKAASNFNKAYSRENNRFYKARAAYFLGMSYYHLNQPGRAATAFGRAVRNGYAEPEVFLHWGQALRQQGEYENALDAYQEYLEYYPGDVVANNGIASCRLALRETPVTRYEVSEVKDLNSRYSDYSPAFEGSDFSTLYFTSMRKEGKKRKNTSRITGQGSSMVYVTRQLGEMEWDEPKPFTGDIKVDEEDGTPSFTADGKQMFFTRCAYLEEGPSGAAIYFMKKMGGRWGNPEKIEMGPDSLVFAHPAISPDGEYLYFVSDMPGGRGGLDIWRVKYRPGGEWGAPVNLGPEVNTPGDEMFPYVRSNGQLYFSSNGLIGYGGLDLFEAREDENSQWSVRNMGLPVNSTGDDFGIVFKDNREAGFFSSSRNSSRGVDDIFSFERPLIVPTLAGRVLNSAGDPLEDAGIQVVGDNGTNVRISSLTNGNYQLILEPDARYVIMASAPGYLNKKEQLSTLNMTESKVFERDLVLESVRTAILLYDITFSPGQTTLNSAATLNLDRLAGILSANSDYRLGIQVYAFGNAGEEENLMIAQKRAQAIEAYLLNKGVDNDRLELIPSGSSRPMRIDRQLANHFSFLTPGREITPQFISSLPPADQRALLREVNRARFQLLQ